MNTNMSRNARLLGLFSGFPEHHFNDALAAVLRENLPKRDLIVFISADPENYAQNDDDRDGMHEMLAEIGLAFAEKHVIDRRTGAEEAVRLVREADCIWLMGGESTWQIQLIRDLGIDTELHKSKAVILGVSAGSMNLGRLVAYVWDDPKFYEALGFTDITIKAHYAEGEWFVPLLKEMSMTHPIVAMEDMSAIFVKDDDIWKVGEMHLFDKGEIGPVNDEKLKEIPMDKGKIIFLNGVTSSGKTSIVEALQERRDQFFYVVANDLFAEMVGEQYLEEDYWKYLADVIIMMYHTAKLYSDLGKNVLIDGILVERDEIKPHYEKLMEIMKDSPLSIVEVYCPLDVCRQRNIERGDRYESQSDEQAELMSKGIQYAMRVDTSVYSPAECAEAIVKTLFA